MSISQQDRPALDAFGYVLFFVVCAGIVAALVTVVHPDGAAPYVLAALTGLYIGLVGTSCFLRGYRRQREAIEP